MSDIFISYASDDREKAARLVEILAGHGWSLWWDNEIPAGKSWADVIEQALERARCVVVLWSAASQSSHWVNVEAREGLRRDILVPVMLDEAAVPLEFRSLQAVRLSRWPDLRCEQELDKLVAAVGRVLGSPSQHQSTGPTQTKRRQWTPGEVGNAASIYFASFLQLIAGPKTFVAGQLEEPRRALRDATLFLLGSYVLGFILTMPLPTRSLLTDFFVGAAFVLFTVLVFGVAVYFSWRLVGGKAPLHDFVVVHFYCAGVLKILEKVFFLTMWGLLRLLSEPAWFAEVEDAVFCRAEIASFHRLLASNMAIAQPVALLVGAGTVLGAAWIISIWGAYRKLNDLSRARSILAGVISIPLGAAAHGICYLVASALLTPQC